MTALGIQSIAGEESHCDKAHSPNRQMFVNKEMGVPTPAASPKTSGINLLFSGDFLYWIAREDGLEYDLLGNAILLDNVMQRVDVRQPIFQWDPGFRLALGARSCADHWECKGQWTYFSTSASQQTTVPDGDGLLNNGVWNDAAGIVQAATTTVTSANWWLHYNLLDAGYSRSFFLGKNLSSDLAFGALGLWIDQKLSIHAPFSEPRSTSYAALPDYANLEPLFTSRYRAGGVFLRAKPQWNFLRYWSVLGGANAYIVYGTYKISQQWFVTQLNGNDLSISKTLPRTRVGLQGSLGLQWQTATDHDRWHMSVCMQYEGLIWFKQNLWSQVDTMFAQNYERRGDLEMQGFSLSTRLDF